MTEWWTIAALGSGIYALRIAGMIVPIDRIPERWSGSLRLLPVALLAALLATSRAGGGSGQPDRIAALLAALAVAWWTRKLWAAIGGGMLVYLALYAIQ